MSVDRAIDSVATGSDSKEHVHNINIGFFSQNSPYKTHF